MSFSILLHTIIVLVFSTFFLCNTSTPLSKPGNYTDHQALLSIKASIVSDPLQFTTSWNESTHFCEWAGITCGRKHQRVTKIDFHSTKLGGSLSPYIGNLSFLRELLLYNNSFTGIIPEEIGRLSRLQVLNLSNNLFSGEIPKNISHCFNLITLRLDYNDLTGRFPLEFQSLSKLQYLAVFKNNLVGEIPAYIGNFSSLVKLSFMGNNFEGKIPDSLGQLHKLSFLSLAMNNLSGAIPSPIFNLSSLEVLEVLSNRLHGYLPLNIGSTLPSLEHFNIGNNHFIGSLPSSISNATRLRQLDATSNGFTGRVPSFNGLDQLDYLGLSDNPLGNGKSNDLDSMLSQLLNSTTMLQALFLAGCNFGGVLPRIIGNFSRLRGFSVAGNVILGDIPSEFGLLFNLEYLELYRNQLSGTIPSSLGSLQLLNYLNLAGNKLSGEIPSSIGNMSMLSKLYLQSNNLLGSIPISLEESKNLLELNLARNELNGYLPKEIFHSRSSLVNLDFSTNHFTGPLPSEIGGLKHLVSLNLSNNMLSGALSNTLGSLAGLTDLNLSCNFFQGFIPSTFASLKSLQALDLSRNNLTGKIPKFLGNLPFLNRLNLSFNEFDGEVPSEGIFKNESDVVLSGNNKLCGGLGKFSNVYRGILEDGLTFIAVKVLKLDVRGASKSFLTECEALRQIRHRNLVKILTSCCSIDHEGNDFMAIVYEYMVNGSLDKWLQNHSENSEENNDPRNLSLLQRVNIVIDVTNALDYLHNHLETYLVHCDLKPCNILLDGNLVAHVGDFGLAKFLPTLASSSHQMMSSAGIKGTIGYAAPEYGMGSELSTYGDIYSYGILLLEIFTGKSPTSDIFNNGLTLHNYVRVALPKQVTEVVDPKLFHTSANATSKSLVHRDLILECLISIFKIGIACSVELPRDRMNIGNVLKELHSIKDTLLKLGDINTIPW
ncbi:PREDICTED: probable LRR receptor-like serine/threonine-protein kinase At3g47570 [Ipomoea nil]|uniref:probable LRR receptor-like serine/threonine-protein kinase At3g47570 n=1 Tax=Ipomoea nil TaxID=35883 RepID=UPI000901B0D0|nr:PREDICTED: probable LRR receptor-like serine/threonine-protein kinase At3g47570 [Ipomoea nil]